MSEWIPIERWQSCLGLERPGIAFELRNRAGQTFRTRCVVPLPAPPFDWTSPPIEFRPVAEGPPAHSPPIPKPRGT